MSENLKFAPEEGGRSGEEGTTMANAKKIGL